MRIASRPGLLSSFLRKNGSGCRPHPGRRRRRCRCCARCTAPPRTLRGRTAASPGVRHCARSSSTALRVGGLRPRRGKGKRTSARFDDRGPIARLSVCPSIKAAEPSNDADHRGCIARDRCASPDGGASTSCGDAGWAAGRPGGAPKAASVRASTAGWWRARMPGPQARASRAFASNAASASNEALRSQAAAVMGSRFVDRWCWRFPVPPPPGDRRVVSAGSRQVRRRCIKPPPGWAGDRAAPSSPCSPSTW